MYLKNNKGNAIVIVIVILSIFLALGLIIGYNVSQNKQTAQNEAQVDENNAIGSYGRVAKVGTSTSSPVTLGLVATTTLGSTYVLSSSAIATTEDVDSICMNLYAQASTSAVISWTYFFSENNIDWYPEEGNSDTSDIAMTHGATDYIHNWTPGKTTVEEKHTCLTGIVSRFTKVTFSVTVASSTLYADIIK